MLSLLVLINVVLAIWAFYSAQLNQMNAKTWPLIVLMIGPLGLILMRTHRRMHWQRHIGRDAQLVLF